MGSLVLVAWSPLSPLHKNMGGRLHQIGQAWVRCHRLRRSGSIRWLPTCQQQHLASDARSYNARKSDCNWNSPSNGKVTTYFHTIVLPLRKEFSYGTPTRSMNSLWMKYLLNKQWLGVDRWNTRRTHLNHWVDVVVTQQKLAPDEIDPGIVWVFRRCTQPAFTFTFTVI